MGPPLTVRVEEGHVWAGSLEADSETKDWLNSCSRRFPTG